MCKPILDKFKGDHLVTKLPGRTKTNTLQARLAERQRNPETQDFKMYYS